MVWVDLLCCGLGRSFRVGGLLVVLTISGGAVVLICFIGLGRIHSV